MFIVKEIEKRDKVIAVRVTQTMKLTAESMAEKRGMTVSELVLCLLENELQQPVIT